MSFLSTRFTHNATVVGTPERLANPQRPIVPKTHYATQHTDPAINTSNQRSDNPNLLAMFVVQGFLESVANVTFVNKLFVAKNLMTYMSAVGLVYMASSKSPI